MHPYEFLQNYGPAALVIEAHTPVGQAFAEQLAKGGFDLLLPHPPSVDLGALAARLEDHEGVRVDLQSIASDAPDFAEQLLAGQSGHRIGLVVCSIAPDHPPHAGSLITSLTGVYMPSLEARHRSGVILVDLAAAAERFADTLARELLTVDTDVLLVQQDNGSADPPAGTGALAKRAIAELGETPHLALAFQS
ncbi:MAG: hypothetical protein V2J89_07810 [Halieaceae bacterium]|jgi:hypothetical protein|nr:hypothetical protein [Halieaceae bacterium]